MDPNENEISRRQSLEAALWEWSGFSADATTIAALMVIIDAYALEMRERAWSDDTEGLVHTLIVLAEQLLGTGGRMQLIPVTTAPPLAATPRETPREPAPAAPFAAAITSGLAPAADAKLHCNGCNRDKSPDEFHIDRSRVTGRKSRCKLCTNVGPRRTQRRAA